MSVETSPLEGQSRLVDEVIKAGICVRCGACVGLCPYFHYYDGKVIVSDGCDASTWRCVQVCPRMPYERSSLYEITYGSKDPGGPLGPYQRIVAARSTDQRIRAGAQYGGVITSLTLFAMDKGIISAAVLTDKGENLFPQGVVGSDRESVLNCMGSRYTASASFGQLNLAIKEGKDALAFVGLPCQMEALSKMAMSEPDGKVRAARVALRLGLFCTWALDYRALRTYLETKGVRDQPKRYDIPPPPSEIFVVEAGDKSMEFPLTEVRELVQPGCMLCEDMTAEFADISVGTLEGDEQWNTVIVRTDKGLELFEMALDQGVLEHKEIPKANLDHLSEAASNKKKRAVRAREEANYE
ncbi:MAG: hypothetical protein DRG71_10030 [Deltaproteobacteria bacterium]|nr:MAG: hypothetical protein DRG71_10030 [Deltaproteobacteria bacterium]